MRLKGSEVVVARERLGGITQEELGELIGKSQSTVSRWEQHPDESIPWVFSQRIRGLLRKAKQGKPLGASAGMPGDAVLLLWPVGLTGPEVWVRLKKPGGPKQVKPQAAVEGTLSAPPTPVSGTSSESAPRSFGRFLPVFAGVAAALLVGCLTRMSAPAGHPSFETRRCELTDGKSLTVEGKAALLLREQAAESSTNVDTASKHAHSKPMPSHPYEGQKLAPCSAGEVEKVGGCWFKGDKGPPCASIAVESEGSCFAPIPKETEQKKPIAHSP